MVLKLLFSLNDLLLNSSYGYSNAGTIRSVAVSSTTPLTTPAELSHADDATPTYELLLGTFTYLIIILLTIFGNILVIVAVFTYVPLKKVQNYLLVSLAASDLAVALFVMPLHVVRLSCAIIVQKHLTKLLLMVQVKFLAGGHWLLGMTVCQLFTTADILLCTSSILNLCAIALDRYWAIHDPLAYAQKRTRGFVCKMILSVWFASLVISVPPLIGWNDWTSQKLMDHCELTTEKAFVVFSASGSFFVPLIVMTIVYVKIYLAARHRIRANRGRSALSKLSQPPPPKQHSYKNTHVKAAEIKPETKREFHSCVECNSEKRSRSALAMITTTTNARIIRRPSFLLKKRRSASHSNAIGSISTSSIFHTLFFDRGRKRVNINGPLSVASAPTHLYLATSDVIDSGVSGVSTAVITQNGEASTPSANHKKTELKGDFAAPCTSTTLHRQSTPPPIRIPSSIPSTTTARRTVTLASQQTHVKDSPAPPTPIQSLDPAVALKQREKISVAKEKRAAKTIAVIIFCFVGCWVPFFCAYVILPFCEKCTIHPKILQAFTWLGYINSSLNVNY